MIPRKSKNGKIYRPINSSCLLSILDQRAIRLHEGFWWLEFRPLRRRNLLRPKQSIPGRTIKSRGADEEANKKARKIFYFASFNIQLHWLCCIKRKHLLFYLLIQIDSSSYGKFVSQTWFRLHFFTFCVFEGLQGWLMTKYIFMFTLKSLQKVKL